MSILQVILFGSVRVTHNNWLTEVKLTREVQALLAYLLLYRHRTHPREVLAGVFWGERSQDRARGSLNTTLWRMRKLLEPDGVPPGTYLIGNHSAEVGFNRDSQYWLDVEDFEKVINHVLAYPFQSVDESDVHDLEEILRLYKGELLEGFYEDWTLRERERLRGLYLKSLIYLQRYCRFHKLYEKGIVYGLKILELDPLREDIHREMMKLYLENGQRSLAARQYEICRTRLSEELGILPMRETQALYAQIFLESHEDSLPLVSGEPAFFKEAMEQLHEAAKTIDHAQEQIQKTLQFITRLMTQQD